MHSWKVRIGGSLWDMLVRYRQRSPMAPILPSKERCAALLWQESCSWAHWQGTACEDLALPEHCSWIKGIGSGTLGICQATLAAPTPCSLNRKKPKNKQHLIVAISFSASRNKLCMEGLSWQLDQSLQSCLKPFLCKAQSQGYRSGLSEGGGTEKATQDEDWSCHKKQQLLCWSKFHRAISMYLSSLGQYSAWVKENIHIFLKNTLGRYIFQSLFTTVHSHQINCLFQKKKNIYIYTHR